MKEMRQAGIGRRVAALVLAAVLCLTMIPVELVHAAGVQSGRCGMDLTWTYEPREEVLTIEGTGEMLEFYDGAPWEDFYIKRVVVGDGVTSLSRCAFNNRIRLVDVQLGQGLTTIGEYAFADCPNLPAIRLPDTVTTIGDAAFSNCTSLRNVQLGGAVTLGDYAFYGCTALERVTLPESVRTLGLEAFCDCTGLRSIALPDALETVEASAFAGCSRLSEITLGKGLRAVGEDAFRGTAWEQTQPEGILYLDDWVVGCKGTLPAAVELREGVRGLSASALAGHSEVTALTLPATVEIVGDRAFGGCTALETAALPESVRELGWNAFSGCTALREVSLGRVAEVRSGVLQDCTSLEQLTIPASVTHIHPDAFLGCTSLRRLEFLGDAPVIWWGAFRDVQAEAVYPAGNATWTEDARQDYGGSLTWVSGGRVETLPAPEAHLLGDGVTGKPVLSWESVLGAASYHIYGRRTAEGEWAFEAETTDLSYINTEAIPGEHYYYQVCAVSADGVEGAFSAEKHRTCDCAQPVADVTINQEGKPMVTWNRVPGAVKYQVYRSVNGGEFTRLFTTEGTRMSNGTAEVGQSYSYQVVAVCSTSYGNSIPSEPVTARCVPAAPVVQAETDAASGQPCISWAPVEGAVRYEIWSRSQEAELWEAEYTTEETAYTAADLLPGQRREFQIRAVMEDGTFGVWSDAAQGLCTCAQPTVTVTHREDGKPVLTWEAVPGAEKYEVYRAVYGGQPELVLTTHGLKMSHGSARTGLYYSYQVKAIAAAEGADSAPSEAAVAQCLLGAPTLKLSVKSSTGKPTLSWNAVSGAEGYQVWRKAGKNGEYKLLTTAKGTRLTNTSAEPGVTYYYQIRPVSEDIPGMASAEKYITCDCARPNVQLSRRSDHPYLSWKAVDGAVKYEVWRSTDGGDARLLSTVKGTHLTNNTAKRGHTYTYRVRAICQNKYGNSAYSLSDTIKLK